MRRALLAAIGVLFVLYPGAPPVARRDHGRGSGRRDGIAALGRVARVRDARLHPAAGGADRVRAATSVDGRRQLVVSAVLLWLGVGLVLPYYGAEAFALNALASSGVDRPRRGVRCGPVRPGAGCCVRARSAPGRCRRGVHGDRCGEGAPVVDRRRVRGGLRTLRSAVRRASRRRLAHGVLVAARLPDPRSERCGARKPAVAS